MRKIFFLIVILFCVSQVESQSIENITQAERPNIVFIM